MKRAVEQGQHYFSHATKALTISLLAVLQILSLSASASALEKLSLKSTAIKDGGLIDKKYTGDGADYSPPLSWSKGPPATQSYALSCEDPDAPAGTWWHWIIFNLDRNTLQLNENVPKAPTLQGGIKQGLNDFGLPGYNGPAPPAGKLHHYHFKVYALKSILSLPEKCTKHEFQKAIKGNTLAEGELIGTYQR